MARHIVVDPSGKVVNIVEWDHLSKDPKDKWEPPEYHRVVLHDTLQIGEMCPANL